MSSPSSITPRSDAEGCVALSAKDSADLGIVISDSAASLKFYVETLGFEHTADVPFPLREGSVMHRIQAGSVTIKLTKHARNPEARNPPGGATKAIGIRYFTFSVTNLEAIVERCSSAGYKIAIPVTEVRPGVRIAMVEDPDGNWVEFLHVA
jgi:catechol 2,3-dioxygenase-like lactoylglutathione lyase family enzyme